MSLLNYWPTAEEVNLCVNHEAEGAHDAVLLAVHQPSPLSYRLISSDRKVEANEDELFKYLITKDVPSGAHVIPITGASGVGKSHTVRILAARLQSVNDDGRYVIIRIPKSASLRRVVELILEKLPGEEYAQVKTEFAKALSEVDLDSAVISFQSQLDIALSGLSKELQPQVKANPGNSALKEQLGHALYLPKFMGDPVLVDYFRMEVFPRIVQRPISGQRQSANDTSVEDFRADDFLIPESIEIAKAAAPTRSYYERTLQVREGEGRRTAARLLNESKVVDQAISQLFKLHESLGGMTLQEVILEIRRLLLKQGRELVILVEDFKALTGIQDTLLNVLIQEGVRDGVRELATMRSVIAVTDGYLAGKDTIATRSKREWVVESHLSNETEVLRRTKELVASYLNAARWGYNELVRQFERYGVARSGQGNWIGPYVDHDDDDNDARILTAFGHESGIPLFPYTDQAIEQLARASLTRNNELVFTPRFIIDNILRALLLSGRPAFETGRFPPADIDAARTNAEVTQWLALLPVSQDLRERYQRVIVIWGNTPRTPAEIGNIPKEVFDAFKLDRPNIEFRSPSQKDERQPQPQPVPTPETADDAYLTDALENWVQKGERLTQGVANQIRASIASALNDRIDWPAERSVRLPITAKQISIPNAGGEGNVASNSIKVADDHSDSTGQLRSEMAAVARFYHLNAGKMHYAGADDDLVWVGNLTERLMPQALALVRASARLRLGVAVRLLSVNSRILGLAERGRTPASLATFLFGAPIMPQRPPDGAPTEFGDWRALQEQAFRVRPELTQLVASYCGSFQGTGKTPYALDMLKIVDFILPESQATDLRVLDPLPVELKQTLAVVSEPRVKQQARKIWQVAKDICTKLTEELGDNFEKQEIADELRALADQLKESGVWSLDDIGTGHSSFKSLCEEFRSSALREALAALAGSGEQEEGKNDGQLISRMGRFDVHPLIVAMRFVETARKVVRVSEKRAKGLEDQFQGVDPQTQAVQIQTMLVSLLNEMDTLGMEGETACC